MADDCLFCRIVAGEIVVPIVAQNEYAVAFRDLHPQAPVHVLIVPRRHLGSVLDGSDLVELGALMALASEVARAEGIAPEGFRIVTNTGLNGGQTVPHLHMHVLGGRSMKWPPG